MVAFFFQGNIWGNRMLADFLSDYDRLVARVVSANHVFAATRLMQLISFLEEDDLTVGEHVRWLEATMPWRRVISEVLQEGGPGTIGAGEISEPKSRVERLGYYIGLFRRLGERTIDLVEFAGEYFPDFNSNYEAEWENLKSQQFDPFSDEFRRYIRKNYDRGVPEPGGDEEAVSDGVIPASDRVVHLDDNRPAIEASETALAEVEEAIRQDNEGDPTIKDRLAAEVGALRRLLAATTARERVIIVLVGGIAITGTEFGTSILGRAVQNALNALVHYLPFLGPIIGA